jgi:hypothetical protein
MVRLYITILSIYSLISDNQEQNDAQLITEYKTEVTYSSHIIEWKWLIYQNLFHTTFISFYNTAKCCYIHKCSYYNTR